MNNFEFYSPTKVIFGRGVEAQVGQELLKWGAKKVLIHYGGGSVVRSGLLAKVEKSLEESGIPYVVLGGAKPNPRLSLVQEGIELCRKEGVDFVLAIGGGSAIDSGKGIALGVPYDGDVWDFYCGKKAPQTALPHANIVTLAATGSETSMSSVVTKEEGMLKRSCNCQQNRPRFTLMDPELLYTLPPYQTACGVVDIMMHTMERYFSKGGINEVTDRIAEAILRTVIQYGRVCMDEPENYEARSEVMWAGSLSHNGLTGLGQTKDFSVHQLGHELSGRFDIPHGESLSAMWPAWARYVMDTDVSRFAQYARAVWGIAQPDDRQAALAGIEATESYFRALGMPVTLGQAVGVQSGQVLRELAHSCAFGGKRKIGSFRPLGEEEIFQVYAAANHM